MKNLFAALTVLLTVTSASAFNANFNPWDNDNNNRWAFNNSNGNAEDNGVFGYNSYEYWDPRWYSKEFTNGVDELEMEFSSDYNPSDYHSFPVAEK
jgi:hypothetical protein